MITVAVLFNLVSGFAGAIGLRTLTEFGEPVARYLVVSGFFVAVIFIVIAANYPLPAEQLFGDIPGALILAVTVLFVPDALFLAVLVTAKTRRHSSPAVTDAKAGSRESKESQVRGAPSVTRWRFVLIERTRSGPRRDDA